MLTVDAGLPAVSMDTLLRAIHGMKPQITEEMLKFYEGLEF
jgi:hypothetical protein